MGRATGSNTVQNMTGLGFIQSATMGFSSPDNPLVQTLLRPVSFLLKAPQEKVVELLADAALNPDVALRLTQKITPERANWLGQVLLRRALAKGMLRSFERTPEARPQG